MLRPFIFSLSMMFFGLSGCTDLSSVQKGYVANRDDCKDRTDKKLALYAHPDTYPMSDKEKATAMQSLFSECMKEHDWKVGPKKEVAKDSKETADKKPATVSAYTPPPGYALVPVVVQPVSPVSVPAVVPPVGVAPLAKDAAVSKATCTPPAKKPKSNMLSTSKPATPAKDTCGSELEKIINKE